MQTRIPILTLVAITLLHKQGVNSYTDQLVEITELVVPQHPRSGDDVELICRFRLEGHGHRLYTVNWWRGKDQFYTYKGRNTDPKFSYVFEGINVAKNESTDQSVVLKNVSEITSGEFKCEVMGEAPAFRTAVDSKVMEVIVPPYEVKITRYAQQDTGLLRRGQPVELNCTARGSKPKAYINWKINGQPVDPIHVEQYRDFEDSRQRITSKSQLHWYAPKYFYRNKAHVTCIATVGDYEMRDSLDIHIDPASNAAYNHQYASAGCQLSSTWTIVTLATILLARSCA